MASSPEPVTNLDRPISSLSRDAFTTLCLSLTVCQGLRERSWEGVAGKIGLSMKQILAMKQHQEQNKGRLLLTTWESLNKTGATVKKLVFALESLKMNECIDALLEDSSITDEVIESAVAECRQLIKVGKLSSLFPGYSAVEFSEALYSPAHHSQQYNHRYHYHHMQHDPGPPLPPVAKPIIDEVCVTEEPQSANGVRSDSLSESPLVPKSIFISYFPKDGDSGDKLTNQLTELTNYLRQHGYTVYYDKYYTAEVQQCGGIDLWKEMCIRKAETILVICTPEYFQDDENALMERGRSRIEVDRKLLRSVAYSNKCNRLIPVLLDEHKNVRNCIPMFVQPFAPHFWPSKKQDLIYCIAGTSKFQLPEIPAHEKKVLKPIVIQIPQRRELLRPQPTEIKEQNSKMAHPHEKKVPKPTVIQISRRKEVPKSVYAQSQSCGTQLFQQTELPKVHLQQHTKKRTFRPFSQIKKAFRSK